jgi:uncharacterized membrane protein
VETRSGFWNGPERRLAKGLGWFSLALGATELAAPRLVSRGVGVRRGSPLLVRGLGLRELAGGVGILTQARPAAWLWARVAGDLLDLGLLAFALNGSRNRRARVATVTAAVAGVTLLDLWAAYDASRATRLTHKRARAELGVSEGAGVLVNRSPADCYRMWRDVASLPRFFPALLSAVPIGDRLTRWTVRPETGPDIEADVEIAVDTPNELIVWQTVGGGPSGTVRFEPSPSRRGTIVRLEGALCGEDGLYEHLRRFKMLAETGEIASTEGQSSGPRSKKIRMLRGLT